MAVARKPNTRANFGRATRLPHRRLRVLRVGRTISIMKNRTYLFARTRCAKWRRGSAHPSYSKCQILLSSVRSGFGASKMSTPHYESAIARGPALRWPLGLENYPFLMPGAEIKKFNLCGIFTVALLSRLSNTAAVARWNSSLSFGST
jgi:hypothetical protein